ncbi:hypothetical protein EC991_005958 [Linnemannia zychae]|nr:hypothetical protein EC991_005958 [Linnemannia zychae]
MRLILSKPWNDDDNDTLDENGFWNAAQERSDDGFCRFLDSQIRFPNVTKLVGRLDVVAPWMVREALWAFPQVETLECYSRESGKIGFADADYTVHPIRALVLHHMGFPSHLQGMQDVSIRMPFLVKLEIHDFDLDRDMLLNLISIYRNLERLQFDLVDDEGSSRAMADFLRECPTTLKSCRGRRHVVLAEDMIREEEGEVEVWGCVGLEELDIEILGLPRLTEEQRMLLKDLDTRVQCDNGDGVPIADREDGQLERIVGTELGEYDEEEKLIRARMQELWRQRQHNQCRRQLTTEEIDALEQLQTSYFVQQKVYRRLGRLTRLRKIGFGRQIDTNVPATTGSEALLMSLNPTFQNQYHAHNCPHYRHQPRGDTLEFTSAAGLPELNWLLRLEEIWFYDSSRRECWVEELIRRVIV